jgi:hypothetical protein
MDVVIRCVSVVHLSPLGVWKISGGRSPGVAGCGPLTASGIKIYDDPSQQTPFTFLFLSLKLPDLHG